MTKIYLLSIVTFFSFLKLSAQDTLAALYCERVQELYAVVDEYHVQPMLPDTILDERIMNLMLQELDYFGVVFTQQDIEGIQKKGEGFAYDIHEQKCEVITRFWQLYNERMADFISEWESDEIWKVSFDEQDTITLFGPLLPMQYQPDAAALQRKRIQRIKYLILIGYLGTLSDYEQVNDADFWSKKDSLIRHIREIELCKREQHLPEGKISAEEFMNVFLRALASSFDPHTNYMSVKETEEFEFSLSDQIYSVGIMVNEPSQGVFSVGGKVPGSAAWEVDQIEEGDEILQLAYEDKRVIPACIGGYELVSLLNNATPKKLSLQLKKQTGQVQWVELEKKLVVNIENEVGAFVLSDSVNVGYLTLPSFYQSQSDRFSSSSQDVAMAILRLRKKALDGLILDLRYNGGGSVQEAVELAGLFLAGAPLMQEASKDEVQVVRDDNRTVLYRGKLMVLVNAMSASASEMFVSMIHDYQRGLIAGSRSFGKFTGQMIGPLYDVATEEEFGALKLTVLKYYGLNGNSYQHTGVLPDVEILDAYPWEIFSENAYQYSLLPDSTAANIRPRLHDLGVSVDWLRERSQQRQESIDVYANLKHFGDSLQKDLSQIKLLPLQVAPFVSATKHVPYDSTKYEYPALTDLKIEVISAGTKTSNYEEGEIVKSIKKDPTLREAFDIMKDWILASK